MNNYKMNIDNENLNEKISFDDRIKEVIENILAVNSNFIEIENINNNMYKKNSESLCLLEVDNYEELLKIMYDPIENKEKFKWISNSDFLNQYPDYSDEINDIKKQYTYARLALVIKDIFYIKLFLFSTFDLFSSIKIPWDIDKDKYIDLTMLEKTILMLPDLELKYIEIEKDKYMPLIGNENIKTLILLDIIKKMYLNNLFEDKILISIDFYGELELINIWKNPNIINIKEKINYPDIKDYKNNNIFSEYKEIEKNKIDKKCIFLINFYFPNTDKLYLSLNIIKNLKEYDENLKEYDENLKENS